MSVMQCCQNPPHRNPDYGEGHIEELGGLKSYVTGSDDSKIAVMLLSDIFGYEAPNFRKIADGLAAAGFFVVLPDFFHGDPFTFEKPLDAWLKVHNPDQSFESAKLVIEDLKSKGKVEVGAAGYCWGAKLVAILAQHACIQAGVMLHPSFTTLEDIELVKVPISVLGAEIDQQCPPELVRRFEVALKAKPEIDSFVKIFPGVEHGFSVRYKDDDETAVKAANEAFQDTLDWFVKHLK